MSSSQALRRERFQSQDTRPLFGITLKILSVTIFVVMSTCLKSAGELPTGQMVFFRSAFALVPIFIMLAWQRQVFVAMKTSRPVGHVLRGCVGVCAMMSSFFALTRLPLPEAVTLNYAQPLLLVVFSAIFMGEIVRAYRWAAVLFGFIGVFIISWPNLTLITAGGLDNSQVLGVIAALTGATCSAVAVLLVRKLVRTERSTTVVLWFTVTSTVIGLMTWPFGWAMLSWTQAIWLIAAGLCGGVAQILMTESYRHAEASTVAPFEYTSMILAIVVGYFVFAETPTLHMIVGGCIVIAAGLFIILREHRLGLDRGAARKAAAPGT